MNGWLVGVGDFDELLLGGAGAGTVLAGVAWLSEADEGEGERNARVPRFWHDSLMRVISVRSRDCWTPYPRDHRLTTRFDLSLDDWSRSRYWLPLPPPFLPFSSPLTTPPVYPPSVPLQ